MAKKKAGGGGGALVIVESPAKARTIEKYLGKGYKVEASIGHIRDLPQGAKQVPEKYKGEKWANLGVNVDKDFEPLYIVPPEKSKQVKKLRDLLKDSDELYLATDEDREGEAISWHLVDVLKPKVPVKRLVFHEITKAAVQESLASAREIDENLVRAQEARRIIDRLYGYEVSPLLWRKVRPKLSAGRVQSVAVRLLVERERERMRFKEATYWDLTGLFATQKQEQFQAELMSLDGKRLPSGKDFDQYTGLLKNPELAHLDETAARELAERLKVAEFRVEKVEEKPYTSRPAPPFTTSTLQQEANRKLGFTARRAMRAAQSLYENGHITYMRTDSTTLSTQALDAARALVTESYGTDYLPAEPRVYQSKVKNAQEAHEAIRPAGEAFPTPDALRSQLGSDEARLYELIWKRTVASQMVNARGRSLSIHVVGEGALFRVSGKTIDFPGYLRAYVEGSDDPDAELADKETVLPGVEEGETLACENLEAKGHTTLPPSRFSEAALTKALEEKGIGRPSTYASIIETIQDRGYVFKKGSALVPAWVAFSVVQLMESHLTGLIDYGFTAELEDDLDAISRGEREQTEYLRNFYFGNGKPGLKKQLDHKVEEIDARTVCSVPLGKPEGSEDDIVIRVGRYGPYIEHGERRASITEGTPPDEMTIKNCVELLNQAEKGDEPLGECPETGRPVYLKTGRFGPYIQLGSKDDEEKPRNASLLKGMNPEDIDLTLALKLLTLPREMGPDPKSGEAVVVHNGRYGPYVKCGSETRSLGADLSPLDVTLEQALELLAQPKQRRGATKKEPIKVFAESPITGSPVQLLDGRYGPYVTDGETNASLPKSAQPEEFTLEQALDLLAERAAKGPAKKKKKKAAKKKATKKKATKKKATKKKAAKKKATKKAAAAQGDDEAPF